VLGGYCVVGLGWSVGYDGVNVLIVGVGRAGRMMWGGVCGVGCGI
jgi:hypothetical protein